MIKHYKYGKYSISCTNADDLFVKLRTETLLGQFVDNTPMLLNRLFGKGNWEDYTMVALKQRLIDKDYLKEVSNVR